jgi:hypothetical protein
MQLTFILDGVRSASNAPPNPSVSIRQVDRKCRAKTSMTLWIGHWRRIRSRYEQDA